MRKLLLAIAAVLGVSAGLADAGFVSAMIPPKHTYTAVKAHNDCARRGCLALTGIIG
jgi:hypothetical protein